LCFDPLDDEPTAAGFFLLSPAHPSVRALPSRLPYCRWLPVDAIRAVCSLRYRGRLTAAPVAAGVAGQVR
jgi:hypothetical protein